MLHSRISKSKYISDLLGTGSPPTGGIALAVP
jgi:hypothetical protein